MSRNHKPKVLLCWAYHRQHWVGIFNSLKEDFDFVFLNWVNQDFEISSFIDSPKTYWFNFRNIQALVDEIKPDKVVFMSVDGPLTILLNHYCNVKNIPTYMMQHGIFHPYEAYVEEEILESKRFKLKREANSMAPRQGATISQKEALLFFLRSFSLNTVYPLITIFQLELLKRIFKLPRTRALYYTRHTSRKANTYIVFSRYSSSILKKRDGIADRSIREVGNPEADEIFMQVENELTPAYCSEGYYLLIDDPLGEVAEYNTNGTVPKEEVKKFHLKLNEFALRNNKKLLIKLHPDSYNSTFFPVHENLMYIRQANVANLIKFSTGVFGGTSTLLTPALLLKPCCVFKYIDTFDLHKFIINTNYCTILNYLHFKVEDVNFKETTGEDKKEAFTKAYLYSTDRQSVKRIRELLLN